MNKTIAISPIPSFSLAETSRNGAADFEIARVDGLTNQQKELFFMPHRKDFYLIAIVRSGNNRHWLDMVPYSLAPDTIYFSAPHQVFLKEEGTIEAVSICFTQEFLDLDDGEFFRQQPILKNPMNTHELKLSPEDRLFIDDLTEKMLAEVEAPSVMKNSMLLAYLRVFLIYLGRLYVSQYPETGPDAGRDLLHRFQRSVNDHFMTHQTIADYAEMMGLSAGHFSELIKQQSGKTPLDHIQDRLQLEAKRLLFHTDAPIKEIAFSLGFSEVSYFNRFFKRRTGDTPLNYRKIIREKYQ